MESFDRISFENEKGLIVIKDAFFEDLGIAVDLTDESIDMVGYKKDIMSAMSNEYNITCVYLIHRKNGIWHCAESRDDENLKFKIITNEEVSNMEPVFWIKK